MAVEFWTKDEVLKNLKITDKHLKRMREQGAPSPMRYKGYKIEDLCQWIVARPKKRTDRTKVREFAERALNKFLSKSKKENNKTPDAEESQATGKGKSEKVKTVWDTGLIPALDRARNAELDAYKLHHKHVQEKGFVNASYLDAWQKTLDILRKCEKDFSEVLERRREVVEMKEVQQFLEIRIEQTKSILLNIPSKLSPVLESLTWVEIEKKLDQEIRDAISKLTNFS